MIGRAPASSSLDVGVAGRPRPSRSSSTSLHWENPNGRCKSTSDVPPVQGRPARPRGEVERCRSSSSASCRRRTSRLDDERVSRMHAIIEVSGPGDVSIIDLGSTKGTFVNGQKVNKAKLQSRRHDRRRRDAHRGRDRRRRGGRGHPDEGQHRRGRRERGDLVDAAAGHAAPPRRRCRRRALVRAAAARAALRPPPSPAFAPAAARADRLVPVAARARADGGAAARRAGDPAPARLPGGGAIGGSLIFGAPMAPRSASRPRWPSRSTRPAARGPSRSPRCSATRSSP